MKLKRSYLYSTLLLISNSAFSLGLGNAKINSYINQPLLAKIDIKHLGQVAPEDIRVYLSSALDFQRFDIEKTYFLRTLNFRVVYEEGQNAYIAITTKNKIREPLVDFVITVQWPEGNITRDYSLFLNPNPIIANVSEAKISQSANAQKNPNSNRRNNQNSPKTQINPSLDYIAMQSEDSYGPTKDGESISMIAQRVRLDESYSIQRIMRAIHQMNPDAFINGDIDRLKMGVKLKLPAVAETEFKKSGYAYQPSTSVAREQARSKPESIRVDDVPSSHKAIPDDSELRLLSTGEQQDLSPLEIENPTQEDIDRVSNELIRLSLERVRRLKEENLALRKRFELLVERMEEAVEKNARLDEQLAAIQNANTILAGGPLAENSSLATNNEELPGDGGALLKDVDADIDESIAASAEPSSNTESTITPAALSPDNQQETQAQQLENETSNVKAQQEKATDGVKIAVKSEVSQTSKSSDEGWFDSIAKWIEKYLSIWYLVIAIIIGGLVAAYKFVLPKFQNKLGIMDKFSLYRKYRGDAVVADDAEVDDIDLDLFESKQEPTLEKRETASPAPIAEPETQVEEGNIMQELEVSGSGTLSAQEDTADDLDDIFGEPSMENDVEADHGSSVQSSVLPSTENQIDFNDILGTTNDSESATDDSVDIISQSSVYFAYGKFDLAEQLILDGLETDPDNKKYKLKLMECYAKMDNEEDFLTYLTKFSDLYSGDEEFRSKVQKMYKDRWKKELY